MMSMFHSENCKRMQKKKKEKEKRTLYCVLFARYCGGPKISSFFTQNKICSVCDNVAIETNVFIY